MGQKVDIFFSTKVEYYAPYLLKDGLVQRIRQFDNNEPSSEEISITEKFRSRADRLVVKETDITGNKVNENYDFGRPDKLASLCYLKNRAGKDTILEDAKQLTFYHKWRQDGLQSRESRDFGTFLFIFQGLDQLNSLLIVFG